MGNCCSNETRQERNRDAGQEGREFDDLSQQANRPRSAQQATTASNFPISHLPQTQAPLENAITEVPGTDFNRYMMVERIEPQIHEDTSGPHVVGHNFLVKVHVRNNTAETLKFTSTPHIEWKEKIRKTDGENAPTTEEFDQYEKKPKSFTFYGWRSGWNATIAPNEQKEIMILDNPSLANPEGMSRTCSRTVDFDIGMPGSEIRLRATQDIEIANGQTIRNDLQIH